MPIAEESILGVALGMARAGAEVFVDLMFSAFALRTMDVLLNQFSLSALLPSPPAPLVVRMICGPFSGAGPQHSSGSYALLARIPNVVVAAPCLAVDVTTAYAYATRECKPLLLLIGRDLDVHSEQMLYRAGSDIHLFGTGKSLCIVCWGMHAPIVLSAVSAAGAWERTRVLATLLLAPMPIESLLDEASAAQRLLIVDVSAPPTTIGDLLLARAHRRNSWSQIVHEVLQHEDELESDDGECSKSIAMLISRLTPKLLPSCAGSDHL
jgi:pyruvate/2-oxoglutarate/acetoin dehydrogenase E1 component